MVRLLALTCLFLSWPVAAQDVAREPLTVKLIPLLDRYPWQPPLKAEPGRRERQPAPVALVLELTNRGPEELQLYGPPGPALVLEVLDGDKVKSWEANHLFVAPRGKWSIKPGARLRIPVRQLSYFEDIHNMALTWLGPGRYRLHAEMVLGVSPPPVGAAPFKDEGRGERKDFGTLRLKGAPVTLEVFRGDLGEFWLKACGHKEVEVRAAALVALKTIRVDAGAALPVLTTLLGDENNELRMRALEALAEMKKSARPALRKMLLLLKDEDPLVRVTAARSLPPLEPEGPDAAQALVSLLLEEGAVEVRRVAAQELGPVMYHIGKVDPALKAALLRSLEKESDSGALAYLVRALRHVPGEDTLKSVLPHLRDADPGVHDSAVVTVAELCRQLPPGKDRPLVRRAVQEMVLALKDKTKRAQVAWALQYLIPEAEDALDTLVWALEDPDSFPDSPNMIRTGIIRAIGAIGPRALKAAPALVQALHKDPNWQARVFAADALVNLGPEAAKFVPALVQALKDDMDQVRGAAAQALGKLGPRSAEAVPHLLHTLKTATSGKTKASAATALHFIGMKGRRTAIPVLIEALSDPDPQVALPVACVLGQIGPDASEALPLLRRLKLDPRVGDPRQIEMAIELIEAR